MQYKIQRIFSNYEWPSTGYEGKADMHVERIPFRHKHLSEIREWELGLCNNFTEFDCKHFFGKYYDSDYDVYFDKFSEFVSLFEMQANDDEIIPVGANDVKLHASWIRGDSTFLNK